MYDEANDGYLIIPQHAVVLNTLIHSQTTLSCARLAGDVLSTVCAPFVTEPTSIILCAIDHKDRPSALWDNNDKISFLAPAKNGWSLRRSGSVTRLPSATHPLALQ